MPETLKTAPDGSLSAEEAAKVGAAARACRIVALPSDSSYALASNGLVKAAARRMLQVKERSTLKPLVAWVGSPQEARRWAHWTPLAERLAAALWPGPLALLLKPTAEGRLLTFPEYPLLALSCPSHPAAAAALAASGVPWLSASANKSGHPPARTFEELSASVGPECDLLVDGGPLRGGEPTFVDASGEAPRITRAGLIPEAEIAKALA